MTAHKDVIKQLITRICETNSLQIPFLEASLSTINDDERSFLRAYINFCINTDVSIDYLAKCYDVIVKDTLREQIYFQRHGHYRHSSYEDVAHSVYNNTDYMRWYMHGLALTSILWPNHRDMRRFFLAMIPKYSDGNYLEIGPGHGVYFMSAMQLTAYDHFEGIDISQTSIDLTRKLLDSKYFGTFHNFNLTCKDFLNMKPPEHPYEAIIMGEVLEHVEHPLLFLKKINELSHNNTFIYITTCINAPAIDHIYLYDSLSSLENMVKEASFTIADELIVPYEGLSLGESLEKRMPINVALVLKR